jgi:hypothetical protein
MKRLALIVFKLFVLLISINFVFAISLSFFGSILIASVLAIGSIFLLDSCVFRLFR